MIEEKYIVSSLELHLFFARIMKEHAIFLEAGFTPKNEDFMKEADQYKLNFEAVLSNAVSVSNGIVRSNVLTSGEIITDFTLGTEQKTQYLTGIPINQNITMMTSRLHSGTDIAVSPKLLNYVKQINYNADILLTDYIKFKKSILNAVLSCSMFTVNYPLLLEHIIREAELYHKYVKDLENGIDIDNPDIKQTELFWDRIMMEHSLFIRGLLDPVENELITTADNFAGDYARLIESARNANDSTMKNVTNETLAKTIQLKEFKQAGTKGISECKIRSIIIPLLADHVLRESNHYIRLLKSLNG